LSITKGTKGVCGFIDGGGGEALTLRSDEVVEEEEEKEGLWQAVKAGDGVGSICRNVRS
jgi:hypothetical protein